VSGCCPHGISQGYYLTIIIMSNGSFPYYSRRWRHSLAQSLSLDGTPNFLRQSRSANSMSSTVNIRPASWTDLPSCCQSPWLRIQTNFFFAKSQLSHLLIILVVIRETLPGVGMSSGAAPMQGIAVPIQSKAISVHATHPAHTTVHATHATHHTTHTTHTTHASHAAHAAHAASHTTSHTASHVTSSRYDGLLGCF